MGGTPEQAENERYGVKRMGDLKHNLSGGHTLLSGFSTNEIAFLSKEKNYNKVLNEHSYTNPLHQGGSLQWLENNRLWSLSGMDEQNLGTFDGVVASDKNRVSTRFTYVIGQPPPLGAKSFSWHLSGLPNIPVKGLSFLNSDVVSWAACDSCKLGAIYEHLVP